MDKVYRYAKADEAYREKRREEGGFMKKTRVKKHVKENKKGPERVPEYSSHLVMGCSPISIDPLWLIYQLPLTPLIE